MNNSINYCGFVDLLNKPALEITEHAELLNGQAAEPVMRRRVKPAHNTKYPAADDKAGMMEVQNSSSNSHGNGV